MSKSDRERDSDLTEMGISGSGGS